VWPGLDRSDGSLRPVERTCPCAHLPRRGNRVSFRNARTKYSSTFLRTFRLDSRATFECPVTPSNRGPENEFRLLCPVFMILYPLDFSQGDV
jgi:hypothetical protein